MAEGIFGRPHPGEQAGLQVGQLVGMGFVSREVVALVRVSREGLHWGATQKALSIRSDSAARRSMFGLRTPSMP